MKKTFKFFMCAAIMAAGFVGCSSEEVTPTDDPNNPGTPTAQGEQTYATFRFSEETTKASVIGDDSSEGTSISNIRFIIYDNDGAKEVDTLVTVAGTSQATIPLTSGSKKLYVIANAPSGMKTQLDGVSLAANYNPVYDLDNTAGATADLDLISSLYSSNFMMSSTSADADISLTGGITAPESQQNSSVNYIEMTIKRSVAKIYVTQAPAGTTGKVITADSAGIITSPTYQMQNVLSKVYPFQQIVGSVIQSPSYDRAAGPYTDILARYVSPAAISIPYNTTAHTAGKAYFITENMPLTPKRGNSTFAAITTTYTPTKNHYYTSVAYNELNNGTFAGVLATVDATAGQTFYRLKNTTATGSPSVGFSDDMIFAGANAENLTKKVIYHLLNPAIAELTNIASYASLVNATDFALYADTYTNGLSYYRLDMAEGSGNNLKYGVKRNTFYKLNIDSYKKLGAATVEELFGEEEEELSSQTYMTVTVTIAPWDEVSGGQDISK